MKRFFTILASLFAIIFVSCSSNPMVGTWAAKEAGGITHYLKFSGDGKGVYYFESDITGSSSPCTFNYTYEEAISDFANDEVEFGANSKVDEIISIILGGEIVAPNMMKCTSRTSMGSSSLVFNKN